MSPEKFIAQANIEALERKQTRAIREHILGDATAIDRLRELDEHIAKWRAVLAAP